MTYIDPWPNGLREKLRMRSPNCRPDEAISKANDLFGTANWSRLVTFNNIVCEAQSIDTKLWNVIATAKVTVKMTGPRDTVRSEPVADFYRSGVKVEIKRYDTVREATAVGHGEDESKSMAYRRAMLDAELNATHDALKTLGSVFGVFTVME